MRLEDPALRLGNRELERGDHLAGALALADVAGAVFPRVGPVRVERGIRVVLRRVALEIVEYLANLGLADPTDELRKPFVLLPHAQVEVRDAIQGVGNPLRGNGHDRQSIRTRIFFPLSTEDDLKVRHLVAIDDAGHAVKPNVGHVVLPATIEAAADLDVQVLDGLIHLKALLGQARHQFGGQPARRRNAQLASVGAGASHDVQNVAGAGAPEPRRVEGVKKRGNVGLAHPANHEVLFDRRPDRTVREPPNDVGQGAKLISGNVAERQCDRRGDVAFLALLANVGLQPPCITLIAVDGGQFARRIEWRLVLLVDPVEVLFPARVVLELLPLLEHLGPELINAPLADEELDARFVAVLLLTVLRVDPRDCLRHRQEFLGRQKLVEDLGLLRHGAESAAHHEPKALLFFAIHHALHGGVSNVVHCGQAAGMLRAAAECGLKLATEVLHVRVTQQKARQHASVGRNVEDFVRAYARVGTGSHVADTVAASLPSCDAHGGQAAHERRDVVEVDEMQLEVLTGGDVGDSVGVLLGQFRHRFELLRVHPAVRDLDSQHPRRVPQSVGAFGRIAFGVGQLAGFLPVMALAVVVALAVGAAAKPRLGENLLVDLALAAQLDLRLEFVNLLREVLGELAPETLPPQRIACFHLSSSGPVMLQRNGLFLF